MTARHPIARPRCHETICVGWWRCPRRTRYVSKSRQFTANTRRVPSASAAAASDASARSIGWSGYSSLSSKAAERAALFCLVERR
jgi:hypothetical protein